MPVPVPPDPMREGEVPILTRSGNLIAVPQEQAGTAVKQGGRVASSGEVNEALHGTVGDMWKTLGLGAAETITGGVSTPALQEAGLAYGGKQGQLAIEDEIRALEQTNPIAHVVGEVAPLLLAPEAAPDMAAAEGAGLLERGAMFAGKNFLRGAGETAYTMGSHGISEDSLNHELAAESFWMHGMQPEALFGGLLNVGVAGGFAALGKAGKGAMASFGRVGEVAATDARALDEAIAAGQRAGLTSDEVTQGMGQMSSLAQQRAAAGGNPEKLGLIDRIAKETAERASNGSKEAERRYLLRYKHGSAAELEIGKEIGSIADEATGHLNELLRSTADAQDSFFWTHTDQIRKHIDPTAFTEQIDAARKVSRELRATLEMPKLPPEPAPIEDFQKGIIKEWRKQGTKAPKDPIARQAFDERAMAWAEAARASALEERATEVSRLMAERESRIDPVAKQLFGDLATSVGRQQGVTNKLLGAVDRFDREITIATKIGGDEGAARAFKAFNDLKKLQGLEGKYAKVVDPLESDLGRMPQGNYGETRRFARWFAENKLRPIGEDSNLWGERLASFQAENNKAFSESHNAIGRVREMFTDATTGKVDKGKVRSFFERMEKKNGLEMEDEILQKALDGVRTRSAALKETAGGAGALDQAHVTAGKLEELIGKGRKTSEDLKAVREMRAAEMDHGLHGVVGKALNFAVAPSRALEMLAGFRRFEIKARDWIGEQSKSFFSGAKEAPLKPLSGDAERKATMRVIEDVRRYRDDPRELALALKGMIGHIAEAAPNVSSSISTMAARAVFALAEIAPEPLPPRITDAKDELRYDPGELADFYRQKQIVTDPRRLGQLMRSGNLHEEDAQLAQRVVPTIFEALRTQMIKDLWKTRAAGKLKMSYQEQLIFTNLTGMQLDATQDAGFLVAMQQSAAQDPTNQGDIGRSALGGGRPMKVEIDVDRTKTLTEKMEE